MLTTSESMVTSCMRGTYGTRVWSQVFTIEDEQGHDWIEVRRATIGKIRFQGIDGIILQAQISQCSVLCERLRAETRLHAETRLYIQKDFTVLISATILNTSTMAGTSLQESPEESSKGDTVR